jgi:hypothetical protein
MKKWLRYIWEDETWIIKLFLLIVFAFNLGLPQGCFRVAVEDFKKTGSAENRFQEEFKLRQFIMKKVDLAQQKMASGDFYSPYDYFQDLADYYAKQKELKISNGFSPEINRLMDFVQSSINRGPFTNRDIEKAREQYKEFIDPGRVPREEIRKIVKALGWRGVLVWFFWLYFYTLPLIFFLYLIWMRDERRASGDYGPFKFPKPLRFLALLVGYPLVFGYYMIRWWFVTSREAIAEAELRRTNRLFAYISEENLERIKGFAKSNLSLSEWRRQLREMGLKPRHTLASALMVTLMFMFFIRPAEAGAKKMKNYAGSIALEQIESFQNLPRMGIDKAMKIQAEKSSWTEDKKKDDLAIRCWQDEVFLPCILVPHHYFLFPLAEFFRKIFHVPLQAVWFEEKLAQTQL